jgi:hypothetical protein
MTGRIIHTLRTLIITPAWAVHFHGDGFGDDSSACFDEPCGRPPLATDHRLGA